MLPSSGGKKEKVVCVVVWLRLCSVTLSAAAINQRVPAEVKWQLAVAETAASRTQGSHSSAARLSGLDRVCMQPGNKHWAALMLQPQASSSS